MFFTGCSIQYALFDDAVMILKLKHIVYVMNLMVFLITIFISNEAITNSCCYDLRIFNYKILLQAKQGK